MKGQLITIEGISGVGKTYYFNKLKIEVSKASSRINTKVVVTVVVMTTFSL